MTEKEMLLRIENISKIYDKKPAIDGVSFQVPKGEVFALIGPNGAGKSTTIKAICGLLKTDKGSIFIKDKKVNGMNCASEIGYLPGEMTFRPRVSAGEYLMLVNDFKYKGRHTEDVKRLMDIFNLEQYAKTFVTNLSYGNQRKLGIAAAFLGSPELIVLDEPTNGIDTEGIIRLKELIREKTESGSTILIASHMLDFLENICDRTIFIKDGKIVGDYENTDNLEEIYKEKFL